jgi:polar amino acid transport system substrate-binding protein
VVASRLRILGALAAAVIVAGAVAGACSSSEETGKPAGTPVANVADDQLNVKGKLIVCADMPYPPQEFLDESGNPTGSDIEIAQALADRLGLTLQVENTVWDTIIQALSTGKCDLIISAMTITDDRAEQIDFIPYFVAGQAFVVLKDNPENITSVDDLCGKAVAAETGTTEDQSLRGTDAYEGKGLSDACVAKGKEAIEIQTYQKDSDALLALQTNKVDAYFTDSPVAAYQVTEHGDSFQLVPGLLLDTAPEGIGVPKDKTGLKDAVKTALKAMIDDGSYMAILEKYELQDGAVTSVE